MLRTFALCSLALPLLAGASSAQTSWTVDDNGPADFATIVAAVGSALVHDGDVLLVDFAGFVAWLQAFLPAGGAKWLAFNPASVVLRF